MDDLIKGKCCMASYCKNSEDGEHCNINNIKMMEECVYSEAIGEISRLSMALTETYDKEVNSMYSKKYKLEKIEEFNGHNDIYDNIEGRLCYPAYFNVGERGWFLYIEDFGWYEYAHRIHTSIIEKVEYIDDIIIVETQNTRFLFKLVDNKEIVDLEENRIHDYVCDMCVEKEIPLEIRWACFGDKNAFYRDGEKFSIACTSYYAKNITDIKKFIVELIESMWEDESVWGEFSRSDYRVAIYILDIVKHETGWYEVIIGGSVSDFN